MTTITSEQTSLNDNKEQLFYDLANKHILSLNKKYQSKAVIDKKMRENNLSILITHWHAEKQRLAISILVDR